MNRMIVLMVGVVSNFWASTLSYTTPEATTRWVQSARFGLLFDWSARVNFESDVSDSYDQTEAKGLQKGSLYSSVNDASGTATGLRNWELWNPTAFDPRKWLDVLTRARAGYFVFTLNDRYGFLNFDSPATTLDIAATQWGVDAAQALATEAGKRNLPYFWSFQQYGGIDFILGPWLYFKSRWNRGITTYAQYRKESLFHIITHTERYGQCAGIYFSGNQGGVVPSEHPAREGEDPEWAHPSNSTYLKTLLDAQPWLTISSEFYLKQDPNYHPTLNMDRFKFRNYNTKPTKRDGSHSVVFSLESDLSGWADVSVQETRTAYEVIHLLALAAGHNENLLLRVTPDNTGAIPQRQKEVLWAVGEWMKDYNKSIVQTLNGPYAPGAWGVSTRKGNTIFLHILQHAENGRYTFEALPDGIRQVRLLNTGEVIPFSNQNGTLTLQLSPEITRNRLDPDFIVEIVYPKETDTTTFTSRLGNRWQEPLSTQATVMVTQTSTLRNRDASPTVLIEPLLDSHGKGARKLYPRTFWSAPEPFEEEPTQYPLIIELSWENPQKVGGISILEKNSRIKSWRVEYLDSHQHWQKLYEATDEPLAFFDWKLGSTIETSKIRLVITESYGNAPQLRYFRVFGPE